MGKLSGPMKASQFFSTIAECLEHGTFHPCDFEDVVVAINTLRQMSAHERQREKAEKNEGSVKEASPTDSVIPNADTSAGAVVDTTATAAATADSAPATEVAP